MIIEACQVLNVTSLATAQSGIFRLDLSSPKIGGQIKPGQFITLAPLAPGDTFTRPFAVYQAEDGVISIVLQVVGQNTLLYSQLQPGETILVNGPLGVAAEIDRSFHRFIFVGGSCGLTPLYPLVRLARKETDAEIAVLAGFPTKGLVFGQADFEGIPGVQFRIATDDGSVGFHGNAGDLLRNFIADACITSTSQVITCGPRKMLEAVVEICKKAGISCLLFWEEIMACGGMGSCDSCVVKTSHGYVQLCQRGPIFDAADVILPTEVTLS